MQEDILLKKWANKTEFRNPRVKEVARDMQQHFPNGTAESLRRRIPCVRLAYQESVARHCEEIVRSQSEAESVKDALLHETLSQLDSFSSEWDCNGL